MDTEEQIIYDLIVDLPKPRKGPVVGERPVHGFERILPGHYPRGYRQRMRAAGKPAPSDA